MKKFSGSPHPGERQNEILQLLLERSYPQKELIEKLGITAPALTYHLKNLEKDHLIEKVELRKMGKAVAYEIRIPAAAMQDVRNRLGLKVSHYTLITGFGTLEKGYQIPDTSFKLLKKEYYPIDRVVCFTSPEAKKIREDHAEAEKLMPITEYRLFSYADLRDLNTAFFTNVEKILGDEMKSANIIIDLTPLSKLYSLKMLQLANRYNLSCFVLGGTTDQDRKIIWLTHLKLDGTFAKK